MKYHIFAINKVKITIPKPNEIAKQHQTTRLDFLYNININI